MIFQIIITLILVVGIALILRSIQTEKNITKSKISFKEAIDLTSTPILTFENNGKKLNLLLDTGSDMCHIDKGVLNNLKYSELEGTTEVFGLEGNVIQNSSCNMQVGYSEFQFDMDFMITDFSSAFDKVQKETGVKLHGILGCDFFTKYKYVLDFASLCAYKRK